MPLVEDQLCVGLDVRAVIEPAVHQIDLKLSILQIQSVSGGFRCILGPGENCAGARSREDPGGESELVIEVEVGDVAGDGGAPSVKARRVAHFALNIFGALRIPGYFFAIRVQGEVRQ